MKKKEYTAPRMTYVQAERPYMLSTSPEGAIINAVGEDDWDS